MVTAMDFVRALGEKLEQVQETLSMSDYDNLRYQTQGVTRNGEPLLHV